MNEEGTEDKVMLNVNMIVGNILYRKGETIDRGIIPNGLRKRSYYSRVEPEESPSPPEEKHGSTRKLRRHIG